MLVDLVDFIADFWRFLKNQGLNLQHTDFSHFLREVCPTFLHHPKNFFSTIFLENNFKRNRLVALILYIKVSAFLYTLFFTKVVGYCIMLL